MRARNFLLTIATLLAGLQLQGCNGSGAAPSSQNPGPTGKGDSISGTFRLDGFDETILVGNSDGQLVVVKVGRTSSRTIIDGAPAQQPWAVHAHNAKFYVLYQDGSLVVINPDQGTIDGTIKLPVDNPTEFEFATDTTIYVSAKSPAQVVKVDLAANTQLSSTDLSSLQIGAGSVEPHHLLLVGDLLFVKVARGKEDGSGDRAALAVVDTTQDRLNQVIELQVKDPKTGAALPGIEGIRHIDGFPDMPIANLPIVLDPQRNKLLVPLGSDRKDTGMMVRVDPETLSVLDFLKSSAFQGEIALGRPFTRMFKVEHTRTPTDSSHLMVYSVADDGTLTPLRQAPLVDAFDGQDALTINGSGTLAAMANSCPAGFCIGGAGVRFIDANTNALLPKLMANEIGFEPTFVLFKN